MNSNTIVRGTAAAAALLLSLSFTLIADPGASASHSQTSGDTAPAAAELPRWMKLTASFRSRWELPSGYSFVAHGDGDYATTRLRFGMGITPFSWLTFYGEAQDSHVLGYAGTAPSSMYDPLDL